MLDMNISDHGLGLIKRFEGFSPVAYLCPAGKETIGYGHVIRSHEGFNTLDEQQADELLRKDVLFAESAISQCVNVSLNQNQYDALVSFTFNLGGGNLLKSTLLELLNEGDYLGAANQFLRWVYVGDQKTMGLISRRDAERTLFLDPVI